MKKLLFLAIGSILFTQLVSKENLPFIASASSTNIYDSSSLYSGETSSYPEATFYSTEDEGEISEDAKALNLAMTGHKTYRFASLSEDTLSVTSSTDLIPVLVSQVIESGSQVNYLTNATQDATFVKVNDSEYEDEEMYVSMFYQSAHPIIYFNSSYEDEISFYLSPSFDSNALKNLINTYQLTGDVSLLTLDGESLVTLRMDYEKNDFTYICKEGISLSMAQKSYKAGTGGRKGYVPYLKVTIPNRTSITQISVLNIEEVFESDVNDYTLPSSIPFIFDSTASNYAYYYFFSLKSLSIINQTLQIDEASYNSFYLSSSEEYEASKMSAELVSMKLLFKGSVRVDSSTLNAKSASQISSSGKVVTSYYLPYTPTTYECTFTNKSQSENKWYFTGLDLPENTSGEITIQSISFHPIVDGEVKSDLTYTQDFSTTNIYKYSFDIEKAMRTYYYNWQSYYTQFTKNESTSALEYVAMFAFAPFAIYKGIDASVKNSRYNYQCYGFSFYFDDDRKEAIPNVQKITLKWQCGFEKANPADTSGFYSGYNDYRKINISTKEVNDNRLNNGTYALDSDGMFLSDKDSCNSGFTKGKNFDYVVAKLHKRGDKTYSSYISQMAPLEITYETISGEVVRMVGNSKGIHVYTDANGNDFVVNSEGIALDGKYGIYETEDGTKLPGYDKNGDGKITADEVINADTGKGENLADPNDKNAFTDFFNKVADFFNNLTTGRNLGIIISFAILILIIVLIILHPTFFISIGKWFKSLFKKRPKKKKSKKRKKK